MIKYYYRSLRTEGVQELEGYKRGCWVHAESPNEDEIEQLSKKFSLEAGHLQDALDSDEMPRLEKEGKTSYIFIRFAYRRPQGEFATAPLLIVFGEELLLTVSTVRMPGLDAFMRGRLEAATTQRTKLILLILQQIVDQYDTFITSTGKKIKLIRSRLREHEVSDQDFIDFAVIEDELNEFLGSLQPTNATLRRLLIGRHIPLFTEDQDLVEDLLLNNEQSIEGCNSNIKAITGIRDAHASISNNSLNRTMKIMTMATLGIAIPNLCFGIYSMNVPLPLQHEPYMFWIVIPFTILLTVFVFYFGRRKDIF